MSESKRVFPRASHRHGLRAEVGVSRGTLQLDVSVEVEPGELVAVLGPNGAGKTTLLRCLAGVLPIERGVITIGDRVVDHPGAGVYVPAQRRSIGVVFQDYLLFDNMSSTENVAFGLRARGVDRRRARDVAAGWLDRVGLASYATARPGSLSGGQAQRVALARALAAEPDVLLLDEPFAALDASARADVRRDLRRYLAGFGGARLMVTHDPVDAYALADRVIVLEGGRIVQQGTLAAVTAHPRSRYVAELVGLNLIGGAMCSSTLVVASGASVVVADTIGDGASFVAIRPQAVSLHRQHPEGSARNVWRLRVDDIDQRLDRVRVSLTGAVPLVAEITTNAATELAVRPGDEVWAAVKATDITAYSA